MTFSKFILRYKKKDIPNTDREEDYIVLDKVSGNHKKADVYSLIKYVSKNSKDMTTIKSAVIAIDEALDTYKTIIERKIEELKKDHLLLCDDEAKNSEDEIQKITDKYIAMIDSAIDDKTKEILTV